MAKQPRGYKIENSSIHLGLSQKIYPLEAVLNTTYFFIDDYYIFISPGGESAARVEMKAKKRKAKKELEAAAGEFFNTLTAEALRLKLSETSRKFREKILEQAVAAALSPPKPAEQTPPEAVELELDEELKRIIEKTKNANYTDDPLGIAKPITDGPARKKTPAGKKTAKKTKK